MSALLQLPDDVTRSIISEWMNTKCWCLLDMALCNRKLRQVYLNCIPSISCGFPTSEEDRNEGYWRGHYNSLVYEWMYARKIRLTEIYLNDEIFLVGFESIPLIPVRFEHVLRVFAYAIDQDKNELVSRFINVCDNMVHLSTDAMSIILEDLNTTSLSRLTSLHVHMAGGSYFRARLEDFVVLSYALAYCRSLHTLKYLCSTEEESIELLLECFGLNPNITELDLNVDDELLQAILHNYSKTIKKLKIVTDLPESVIGDAFKNCSALTHFHVEHHELTSNYSLKRFVCLYQKDAGLLKLVIWGSDRTWMDVWSQVNGVTSIDLDLKGVWTNYYVLFEQFGRKLTNLTLSLHLIHQREYESAQVARILENCPALVKLDIETKGGLNWRTVFSVPLGIRQFETAMWMRVDDVLCIIANCPHLNYAVFGCVMSLLHVLTGAAEATEMVRTAFKNFKNVEGTNTWFRVGDGKGNVVIDFDSRVN